MRKVLGVTLLVGGAIGIALLLPPFLHTAGKGKRQVGFDWKKGNTYVVAGSIDAHWAMAITLAVASLGAMLLVIDHHKHSHGGTTALRR
jgi:hypothetical protein